MIDQALVQEAIDYIRRDRAASFVNLEELFEKHGHAARGGTLTLHFPGHPNLCLWFGATEEFAAFIGALIESRSVTVRPCNPLVYWIDGRIWRVPVAKSLRQFKSPRWLPVTWDAAEWQELDKRGGNRARRAARKPSGVTR